MQIVVTQASSTFELDLIFHSEGWILIIPGTMR
jgi:hypothetical protein